MKLEDLLDSFAKYLAKIWDEGFNHAYKISHNAAWRTWKNSVRCADPSIWFCDSLRQASENYSWPEIEGGVSIEDLSEDLRRNIAARDNDRIIEICLDIFRWGGVGRDTNGTPNRSRAWVLDCGANGTLAEKLEMAVKHLTDQSLDLQMFDGKNFLMNSAMTKVYAAADPKRLIIYDGRVGAALGLIARDYLYSRSQDHDLPEALAFGWGSSQIKRSPGQQSERDPSDDRFRFPSLFGVRKDQKHAAMMRHASWLLTCTNSMFESDKAPGLAALERALFMIGFDVSRRISVPKRSVERTVPALSS